MGEFKPDKNTNLIVTGHTLPILSRTTSRTKNKEVKHMKTNLIIMCGISCSGKSTTAKKLQEALDIELISTDKYRKYSDFNKVNLDRNPLERFVVYHNALIDAEKKLRNGQDVILDGTFILKLLRQGAYYTAHATNSNAYLIHSYCNNYALIQTRYEQRKKKNNMFEAWQKIEGHNVKYQQFEEIDREVMPDGRPVPLIRNDTEKGIAEIMYSDGSEMIERVVGVLNGNEEMMLEAVSE